LYGNGGSDTLNGGAGNDYLAGGDSADRYLFQQGHGQQMVMILITQSKAGQTVKIS